MARSTFVRQPLPQVRSRYDSMARWYRAAEFTILLPHRLRKKAVRRLALKPGETVLEIVAAPAGTCRCSATPSATTVG